MIEENEHEQPAATLRTSDQAVAAGKSGEQGASAILGSEELPVLKYYGAYVKLLIKATKLGKEKEEAMENILSQMVQNCVKFNDLSRDDDWQTLKSFTEVLFHIYPILVSVCGDSVVEGNPDKVAESK